VLAKGKANWDFWGNIIILLFVPATTYFALRLSNSVVVVCLCVLYFLYFFLHYILFIKRLLGDIFVEYLKAIRTPFILAGSIGVFTYLLFLILQEWPIFISAPILILFGVVYYSMMTIRFNPLFVDELENVLPGKMGKALVKICLLRAGTEK